MPRNLNNLLSQIAELVSLNLTFFQISTTIFLNPINNQ